jgi:hypothetical protein
MNLDLLKERIRQLDTKLPPDTKGILIFDSVQRIPDKLLDIPNIVILVLDDFENTAQTSAGRF